MSTRKRSNHSKRQKAGERLVMGRNTARELFRHKLNSILRVYLASSLCEVGREDVLYTEARKLGVEIVELPRTELSLLVSSDSHQGIVISVRSEEELSLKAFLRQKQPEEKGLLLVVDGVQDPQNLGAILRAAECFGVECVIWSRNRTPDITPTVTKTSAGASELVSCIQVSNVAVAVDSLKEAGYWVAAAVLGDESIALDKIDLPGKIALVVGSEGAGVARLVANKADYKIFIPMRGRIESLNVSQATAVLLHYISATCCK